MRDNNNNNNNNNSNNELEYVKSFYNVKHIMTSTMRTKLLISLYFNKKKLDALREDLEKPSATILHGLKELEKLKLVNKIDKFYCLSSNGYLIALNMLKLIENWYSIESNLDFWKNHNITVIPSKFLRNINVFKKAECIISNNIDLIKPLKKYLKMIDKPKNLKIILPIFSKTHLDALINSRINNDTNLDLVIPENILASITDNGYIDKFYSNENKKDSVNIWKIKENIKLFVTCSEDFFLLSLFFEDGYYDDSNMLLDENKESIRWGLDIFEYYKEKGEKLDFSKTGIL